MKDRSDLIVVYTNRNVNNLLTRQISKRKKNWNFDFWREKLICRLFFHQWNEWNNSFVGWILFSHRNQEVFSTYHVEIFFSKIKFQKRKDKTSNRFSSLSILSRGLTLMKFYIEKKLASEKYASFTHRQCIICFKRVVV